MHRQTRRRWSQIHCARNEGSAWVCASVAWLSLTPRATRHASGLRLGAQKTGEEEEEEEEEGE